MIEPARVAAPPVQPQPETQPAMVSAAPRPVTGDPPPREYLRLRTDELGRPTGGWEKVTMQPTLVPPVREYMRRRRDAAGNFIGGWEAVAQPVGPPDTQQVRAGRGKSQQEVVNEDEDIVDVTDDEGGMNVGMDMGMDEAES